MATTEVTAPQLSPTRADRPEVISERHYCPSCNAQAAEPCTLNGVSQYAIHMQRHHVARRSDYATILRTES